MTCSIPRRWGPSQGTGTVSGRGSPQSGPALLVPPVRFSRFSFTDCYHRRPPSGQDRLGWASTASSPVQGPACCSLWIRCCPDAPQAPCPSGLHTLPCPWLPSAALQGQSLGTGRCTACKRVRRAQVMLIWPRPPAPPCPQPWLPRVAGERLPILGRPYTAERPGLGQEARWGCLRASCLESHLDWLQPHPAPPSPPCLSLQLFLITALTRAPRGQGLPGSSTTQDGAKTAALL